MKTKKMVQGVEIKTIGACMILAVILALTFVIPVAMAVSDKLWLETIPEGTEVGDSEDPWLEDSTITTDKNFHLKIYYHNKGAAGAAIHNLYLLVAVDRPPAGNVDVYVNNVLLTDYNGVITHNNKALVDETNPDYEYSGAGIYKRDSSTRFEVVKIDIQGDINGNGILEKDETIFVPIKIRPTKSVKVHFDAVGADIDNDVVACNPHSHDVTYVVPEFAMIVMPIASILGLVFLLYRKKQKE